MHAAASMRRDDDDDDEDMDSDGAMVPGEACFDFSQYVHNAVAAAQSSALEPQLQEKNGAGKGAGAKGSKDTVLPNGKKTKGRVKIKMEFIDNKLRRYTTFSKRKTGIMKKAYELSTLTGTQVMLLVASETGHVYTFATKKLQPMITSEAGKALIQTCLNSPDAGGSGSDGDLGGVATSSRTDGRSSVSRQQNSSPYPSDDEADDKSPVSRSSYFQLNSANSPGALPTMVPPGQYHRPNQPALGASHDSDGSAASSPAESSVDNGLGVCLDAAANTAALNAASLKLDPGKMLAFPGFASAGGAVMYQVPQGVVYAAPTGGMSLPAAGEQNLMFAFPQLPTDAGSNLLQQQFITIPVPFTFAATANPVTKTRDTSAI